VGSPSALRKLNDRAALYALLELGPLSRHDLEQAIRVSRQAAAELLRRLEESGLARRAGNRPGAPGARGPQAQLWVVEETAAYAAGVDVSHSGIDVVIADLSGRQLGECTVTVDGNEDPGLLVRKALGKAARRAGIRRADVRQVVVGISGSVEPQSGMLSHAEHIAEWTGFNVQERLRETLKIPVEVENDVKLVLSDEAMRGRAVGSKDVLLFWMGQGIASAVIAGGKLQRGFHGSAGELGLVPVAPGGPLADELVSAKGVLALAHDYGITASNAVQVLEAARSRAGTGDDYDRFLSTFSDRISTVLAAPVAVIDPELIILAGDIGTAGGDELAEHVRSRLHDLLAHRPRVVPGTGYDNSVRHGALDESLRRLRKTVFEDARKHRSTANSRAHR